MLGMGIDSAFGSPGRPSRLDRPVSVPSDEDLQRVHGRFLLSFRAWRSLRLRSDHQTSMMLVSSAQPSIQAHGVAVRLHVFVPNALRPGTDKGDARAQQHTCIVLVFRHAIAIDTDRMQAFEHQLEQNRQRLDQDFPVPDALNVSLLPAAGGQADDPWPAFGRCPQR